MSAAHPFQTAVIRTPLFPYSESGVSAFGEHFLQAAIGNTMLRETLYLSSPSLHNELSQQNNLTEIEREKLQAALARYCIRAVTRPTPYGLFAGCTPAALANLTSIELKPKQQYKKNIRLDMHFLGALAQEAMNSAEIRNRLLFFPNNSVYRLGSQFRYVRHSRKDDRKKYHIVAVGYDESLSRIFAISKNGIALIDLAHALAAQSGQTAEELKPYLDSLVEAQFLISELNLTITGAEPLDAICKTLEKIPAQETQALVTVLSRVKAALKKLNETAIGLPVTEYEQLLQLLIETGIKTGGWKSVSGGHAQTFAESEYQQYSCANNA